jgi:hypothetical protein
MAVALHVAADESAVEDAAYGEEGSGAIALVVIGS